MDYLLIARETSTDVRDAGAFWDRTVGYNTDLQGLKSVSERLNGLSTKTYAEYWESYDHRMTHDDREQKVEKYLKKIRRHDKLFNFANTTTYYVREREPTGNSIEIYAGSDLFDD